MTNRAGTISIMLFMFILLFESYIYEVMAEDPHFVVNPNIISKNLHINMGNVTLDLDLSFTVTGFTNNMISAFLTTSGGKSDNALCINNDNNYSAMQKALFDPTKGQIVSISNQTGQTSYDKIHLSLTVR